MPLQKPGTPGYSERRLHRRVGLTDMRAKSMLTCDMETMRLTTLDIKEFQRITAGVTSFTAVGSVHMLGIWRCHYCSKSGVWGCNSSESFCVGSFKRLVA